MTHTITFINQTGNHEVFGYEANEKAALKTAKWLRTKKFVSQVIVYRGQAGAERIATI